MAEGGKSHRKKKSGRKADKRKAAETKKRSPAELDAARKQNPKAFVFASRGKAKIQRARTAEKDQRRMHGTFNTSTNCYLLTFFKLIYYNVLGSLLLFFLFFLCSSCCGKGR